jgi:6,7-dimethyl-8-ribityllumazine synthase
VAIEIFAADLLGEGLRIGIVQARFNLPVCEGLRESCLATLKELGVDDDDVFVCTVPGALEIPQTLQRLARSGEFDALIALGAVIRGETYHFEVVSNESAAGVQRVALDFSIPIANAILTTNTDAQAMARTVEKGADAARVAVEMANLSEAVGSLSEPADEDAD